MYNLEQNGLLQSLCDNAKQINVDSDSREILKMMGMLHSFVDALADYDNCGENYESVCEMLNPVFSQMDSMLTQHISALFHISSKVS